MATKTPGSASAQTEALGQLAAFPLVEALFGRRSRRFALGGEIPDGPWRLPVQAPADAPG
jgi:hypothetical protein